MAREGLRVESQTLWDQLQAVAGHLEPTYDALGRQALATPVIHVDETRWPRLGADAPAAGTVWKANPRRHWTTMPRSARSWPGGRSEQSLRVEVIARKQVAALFYTLCEPAKLAGVDPPRICSNALHAALRQPGAVTLPDTLLTTTTPSLECEPHGYDRAVHGPER